MRAWWMIGVAALACSEGSSIDASVDSSVDASRDVTLDAAQDVQRDVQPDTGIDVGLGFVDVTAEVGLAGIRQWDESYPVPCYLVRSADCSAMALTGGLAVRDVDGDGREDIFFALMEGPDRLFRNVGGSFIDVSSSWGLSAEDYTYSNAAAFADVDNDGDPDLYVGGVGEWTGRLYINEDGALVEDGNARGVALNDGGQHTQMSSCFGDIDLDGNLDLHTTEWRHESLLESTHARMFHNVGNGSFEDVTLERNASMLNVGRPGVWAFTSHLLDLDADRFLDLAVAADFLSSRLLWSEAGTSFLDGTSAARVGTDQNGMGSTLGDIDGDGDLDWFVSAIYDSTAETSSCERCDWGTTGNRLFRYDGSRQFTDVTDEAGVRDGGWGWGTRLFDYDLDGDLDLILTNGVRWTPEHTGFHDDAIRLWENDGTGHFEEVAALRGIAGRGVGRGLVTFDYDLDGDEDVLVMNSLDGPRLWRNDYANGRSWLVVKPVGTTSNRDGFGAVVRVWPTEGSRPIVRHSGNGCGFLGHTPGTPRFGLGDLETVYQIEVYWPLTKARQQYRDVPTRQIFEVLEAP